MEEYIGKVKLDYTFYSGSDLYCDGESEDELLDIVSKHEAKDYRQIIVDRKSWPIFYHLSTVRANIIDSFDFSDKKVLEIGAGCGAITWKLADKAKSVVSVDLSKKRSTINATRNKDKANLEIIVGNFEDIEFTEKYDVITLIGVLEYANSYINSESSFVDMLTKVKTMLKAGGSLIIAIENRLGLKYWAGCKEDHLGKCFVGIEGYSGDKSVQTFSKKELSEIANQAGFNNLEFYYPYPDYKFMSTLYSDDYLPSVNDLISNDRNFDLDRIKLFDESKVFNSLITNDLFEEFSNSFLLIAESGEENE